MAASSGKRDVRLTVGIETAGEENVRALADGVRRLAQEGGEAAPEFAALAAQLDKLGDRAGAVEPLRVLAEQFGILTVEQQQARQAAEQVGGAFAEQRTKAEALRGEHLRLAEAVRTAEVSVSQAKGAAQELAKSYTSAEKQTAAYTSKAADAQSVLNAANLQLLEQRQALDRLVPALKEAEAAERRLAVQFEAISDKAYATDAALRQQTRTLQQAEAAALAAGASTSNLAAADQELLTQVQEVVAATNRLAAAQREAAAATATAARAADESRAATARLVSEARQAGDALETAFGKTGVRSLNAIEAEIKEVDAALSLLERKFRAGALGAEELDRATAGAAVRLRTLQNEIEKSARLPTAFEGLNNKVNDLINRFGALTAAVGTIGIAVKPILDATIALDQMRRVLTTVTGSAEVAEKQIGFLRKTAQEAGQSFTDIGQSYAKFAASALQSGLSLQQTQDVFKAVSLAAGNLGLSTDQAKRALEALSQIASKGTVGMEELRQQLGDALPGVLPLLAKELGLTQRELQKVVESGQLLASEAIPAIGRSLAALAPQSGQGVSGLVAEWNRLKNTVLEAGTTFTDGPFGAAIGVTLEGLKFSVGSLALGVATVSEAFRFAGVTIYETIRLVADRDLPAFNKAVGEAFDASADRVGNMARSFGFAETATAGLAAAAAKAGDSFAALALKQEESIRAAELRSQVSVKMAEAAEKEAEAVGHIVAIETDAAKAHEISVRTAQDVLRARWASFEAAQREADALRAARAAAIEKAGTDEQARAGIKAYLDLLDQKIAKSDADAAKQQAMAEKARLVAQNAELAAKAFGNQAAQVDQLRISVEAAERAYDAVVRAFGRGKATTDEVRDATNELAKAKSLLRDALDDLSAAFERNLKLLRADAELAKAGLEVELQRARNTAQEAALIGNETAARQANLRIKELEVLISRVGIDLKRQEAEARLRELDAIELNLKATGELTDSKRIEIETRRKNELAAVLESTAANLANKSKVQEVTDLRNGITVRDAHTESVSKSTGAYGGNSTSVDSNSKSMRENAAATDNASVARARYNALLLADPARLVSGSSGLGTLGTNAADPFKGFSGSSSGAVRDGGTGQIQPPDNSGFWTFVSDQRGVGTKPTDVAVPGIGYWTRTEAYRQVEQEAAAQQQRNLQAGLPANFKIDDIVTRAVLQAIAQGGGAPATRAGATYVTQVTLPSGRKETIQAVDQASVDALIRVLEQQAMNVGGG